MFDYTYLVLVLPAVIFAMWASAHVNSTFQRYSTQYSSAGMTGADAARRVLDSHGLSNVAVTRTQGSLTDHYDPRDNTIYLSDSVFANTSTAAIGVASHEAGHAIQHAEGYLPLRIRNAIIPATNIGSRLSIPLILIGLLFMAYGQIFVDIAYLGVACFALSALFQLVTLPTEFDASKRAVYAIEDCGILTQEETYGAEKVLRAAAMTYVAALAVSLAQLLRLVLMVSGSSRRR